VKSKNKISSNFSPQGILVGWPIAWPERLTRVDRGRCHRSPIYTQSTPCPRACSTTRTTRTRSRRRSGGLHRRLEQLPPRASSLEKSSRRPAQDATPFASPSAFGHQVPTRRRRPIDGGLGSGRPKATRRRRAPERGEEGGVAGDGPAP
jgi:hypothetical protein